MFRVSTTPIIRSTQNCNYSLRYCAATSLQRGLASLATLEGGSCTKNMTSTGGCSYNFVYIRITQNCNYSPRYCAASSLQRGQASLATLEGGSCTVPEAVVTVLCNPDDGCGWHPKHVEWTCRIINRLLCVASRWTVINVDQRCTET